MPFIPHGHRLTWIVIMVTWERVEVHKATINVELVIDDGGLMSIPSAKVVSRILLYGTGAAGWGCR